jgi:DNA-binding CsgD family transcriptional regulator
MQKRFQIVIEKIMVINMFDLKKNEWETINEIASKVGGINDISKMRISFLREIKQLVYFDLADFCLSEQKSSGAVSLVDSVLVSRYTKKFEQQFTLNYEKRYEQLDYTKWVLSNPESIVYKESEIINSEAREKSPYYVDYLKPMGLINVMGVSLADHGVRLGAANFYRTEEAGDFSDKDLYILKQFIPHLKNKLVTNLHKQDLKSERTAALLYTNYNLSKREIEILKLVCNGNNNKEIGDKLFISPNTVKKHMSSILNKFHTENRVQLINFLIKNVQEIFE